MRRCGNGGRVESTRTCDIGLGKTLERHTRLVLMAVGHQIQSQGFSVFHESEDGGDWLVVHAGVPSCPLSCLLSTHGIQTRDPEFALIVNVLGAREITRNWSTPC